LSLLFWLLIIILCKVFVLLSLIMHDFLYEFT
ncbi:MAG: hypothetical protein RL033_2003, partial [Pseudomonadota bacterium]